MSDTTPIDVPPHLLHRPPSAPLPFTDQASIVQFFTMDRRLGYGGMSETRLARQDDLGRNVVVKSATTDLEARALVGEARIIARLAHPGVLPLLGLGHDEHGRPAMIMPFVEGRPWRSYIRRSGELIAPPDCPLEPLDWHLGVLLRVAQVLEHAHARSIVHRDVKPGNVMIDPYGEVLVFDWGLGVTTDPEDKTLPRACDVAGFAGTVGHAAPEMISVKRGRIDERTDVYQLGTCLHTVLTGRAPHDAGGLEECLRSVLCSEPADYGPDTLPALAAICHRAMQRQPDDRYPSMSAMRAAIESARAHRRSAAAAQSGLAELVNLRRAIASRTDRDEITMVFCRCCEILRRALADWPENPTALGGLQSAMESIIHYDIAHGLIGRPRRLLGDLPRARPDLEALLATA